MNKFILSAFADEIDPQLKTQMDVLDKYNIKRIEMRGVNGNNLTSYDIEAVKEFKKQMDDRGFKLSAVGSPLGKIQITDDFGPHLDLFKHTLEIAKVMETKYIRLFSFFTTEYEKYRYDVMERMAKFVETAKGYDVILLHENEKEIYGDSAERCLDILKTINSSSLRATFDPANFIQCGVDTKKAFELLLPYIEYMHIKDAKFENGEVVPAGMGDGNIKEILSHLKKMDYSGFLTLEPHLGSFVGASALEQDDRFDDLPNGGPKLFGLAASSLIDIIDSL